MKKAWLIATLVAVTAFSGLAGAGEISDASLNRLLARSGIQDLVKQFPDMLRTRMEQARQRDRFIHDQPSMPDSEYKALEDTMIAAFRPADILQAIGRQVRQSVSEEDAARMLAWYDSDLGRRISQAENDSSSPDALRDMSKSAQSLMADKERVIFAMKLDKLLHMTDMSIEFQADAAVAMLVAFSTKRNGKPPANQTAFRNRIEAGLQKQRYKIRQGVILSTVYTYRRIDMASLDQYRAFLNSPAALGFNQALMSGVDAGMDQAIDTMAKAMGKLFHKQQLQSI